MTNKECDWEMCSEQSSLRVIADRNERCQGCNKYHPQYLKLCPDHWQDLQMAHAAFNLARFAIGAIPTYRRLKVV